MLIEGSVRILGLDPGSRHTGYGIVVHQGSRHQLLASGRLSPPADQPLPQRLAVLASRVEALLEEWRPEVAVLETPFVGRNPRSLIVLAEARGALLATLARCGLAIEQFTPAQVKMAVCGHGRADKEQVARMVGMLLGADRRSLSRDATDALAVALCFASHRPWRRATERDIGPSSGT